MAKLHPKYKKTLTLASLKYTLIIIFYIGFSCHLCHLLPKTLADYCISLCCGITCLGYWLLLFNIDKQMTAFVRKTRDPYEKHYIDPEAPFEAQPYVHVATIICFLIVLAAFFLLGAFSLMQDAFPDDYDL